MCRTTCSTSARTCRPRLAATRSIRPCGSTQSYIEELEADCDRFLEDLEELRSFILPGGTPGRPSCTWRGPCTPSRRTVGVGGGGALGTGDVGVNPLTATYLNRLCDLLFILGRTANQAVGDVLWAPGGGPSPLAPLESRAAPRPAQGCCLDRRAPKGQRGPRLGAPGSGRERRTSPRGIVCPLPPPRRKAVHTVTSRALPRRAGAAHTIRGKHHPANPDVLPSRYVARKRHGVAAWGGQPAVAEN